MQNGQVMAYASRQVNVHERNYLTHDLELATVVFVLKVWRHYLYGLKFEVFVWSEGVKYEAEEMAGVFKGLGLWVKLSFG